MMHLLLWVHLVVPGFDGNNQRNPLVLCFAGGVGREEANSRQPAAADRQDTRRWRTVLGCEWCVTIE